MKKFRLPRKIKKALKKNIWIYPHDEDNCYLMAWPTRSEEDYHAIKKGIVGKISDSTKASRKKRIEKLDKENFVSDQTLRTYVEDLLQKKFQESSYITLIRAKNDPKAQKAYFNFVNAYQAYENGNDSSGNICCLAIDLARKLLKQKK